MPKLITGLLTPAEGECLFDGLPISALGLNVLRPQLGFLIQKNRLVAGSIVDNITLFDDQIDMPQVRQAARQAHIEAEIMRFPMQFNSLVCDMGTTRSSGQKQRILLARALYRTPRIVILDEGTAHIDPEREAQIRTMLRALPITRIIVAYCQAMAEIADRVLRLENGQLVAQSAPTEHARLPATNATMMQ